MLTYKLFLERNKVSCPLILSERLEKIFKDIEDPQFDKILSMKGETIENLSYSHLDISTDEGFFFIYTTSKSR